MLRKLMFIALLASLMAVVMNGHTSAQEPQTDIPLQESSIWDISKPFGPVVASMSPEELDTYLLLPLPERGILVPPQPEEIVPPPEYAGMRLDQQSVKIIPLPRGGRGEGIYGSYTIGLRAGVAYAGDGTNTNTGVNAVLNTGCDTNDPSDVYVGFYNVPEYSVYYPSTVYSWNLANDTHILYKQGLDGYAFCWEGGTCNVYLCGKQGGVYRPWSYVYKYRR